jgi:hypothetical protein
MPDELDFEAAKKLAGDAFDETKFHCLAVEGKISKQQFQELASVAVDPTKGEAKPTVATEAPGEPPASKEPADGLMQPVAEAPEKPAEVQSVSVGVVVEASKAPEVKDPVLVAKEAASRPATVVPKVVSEEAASIISGQPSSGFGFGAAIKSRFGGKRTYFPGKISNVNSNGTYAIEYADGDKEDNVAAELVRAAGEIESVEDAVAEGGCLAVGRPVLARFEGEPMYFSGRISAAHGDGTYDISYDDGDAEHKVLRALIRTQEEQSDVCPLALHPVLKKMTFPQRLKLDGCVVQTSCNGVYLLSYSTYQGHPMYKKYSQEQYLYFATADSTWNISNALGSADVSVYVKQDVYNVCELTKPWKELNPDGRWSKNTAAKCAPHA